MYISAAFLFFPLGMIVGINNYTYFNSISLGRILFYVLKENF